MPYPVARMTVSNRGLDALALSTRKRLPRLRRRARTGSLLTYTDMSRRAASASENRS